MVQVGRAPENVPDGVQAFLAQYLYKTGDGGVLYLFEGS